ncbi:hypothetical protein ABEF95_016201 [Exophiala dermatitidis]
MQSIRVNFAIMSPIPGHGSPFERIGTTLRKYVGSREGFLKARTAIRALAREAGWSHSPSTTVRPKWQGYGYEDVTRQGRVIAERLATEQREFMTEMDLLHMQTKVHETAFHEYLPPFLIQTPR